ncbi:S-layer homology domain-containing protein [Paenibacillus sp. 1_12]|uniref:S-layer homology domain-containing protein n=1 Tax=Paenibacillus sp. 1_12 TaxID=1566278 RepID=UPI0008E8596A|nr:S-layer homology domain-containing protein [Paenibacillus sp. 1_12]SFK77258.1 S-layer homology domain-containing protein [Paenibacillus sp. 1_12]
MKPAFTKKTAQVTVLALIISVMLPVLAFAATGFSTATFQNNTVSATVYSDSYLDASVGDAVYVNVYSSSGALIDVAKAVYSNVYDSSNGWYYTIQPRTISGSYGSITVSTNVYKHDTVVPAESVSKTLTHISTNDNNNTGGGSSGGGGGGGGSISGAIISVSSDGSIDAYMLENALTSNNEVELNLSGDLALIPAKALINFTSDATKTLRVTNSKGTYILPTSVLKLSDLASALGTTVDDLKIKVSISAASEGDAASISEAATALGATQIATPVDFNLVGLAPDGTTQTVDLGSNYVSRILPLTKAADTTRSTGVVLDPTTKKLSFVPSLFNSSDTENTAVIKRNSNSVYTAIELNKSFPDSQGHWAQGYIELLANKLVVDGVTDTTFEPERNITRAEFAALVVRSLGLEQAAGSSSFKDVAAGDWFAGVVGAATKAQIIDGYEDSTFRPNQPIKREELAAMVVRALNYAGAKPSVTSDRQNELLAKYTDANKIVWAQQEVATAIEAGIIDGITDTTIAPGNQATRAQSATMLKRLLTKANFIN